MVNPAKFTENDIKILSINAPEKVDFGKPSDYAEVIFKIGHYDVELKVLVSRQAFSDENLILIARHYFHMQTNQLAETSSAWKLSDDEYARIEGLRKKILNTNPDTIPS